MSRTSSDPKFYTLVNIFGSSFIRRRRVTSLNQFVLSLRQIFLGTFTLGGPRSFLASKTRNVVGTSNGPNT